MSAGTLVALAVAAVLVFWVVGAYNRMVRLRSELVARFGPLDAQLKERHALLERQSTLLEATLAVAGPRLETLRAACGQAAAAREHARARPGAAGAVTSLRLAEEILADARGRLPAAAGSDGEAAELRAGLAGADSALDFARREFNTAVLDYNAAVRQFPTMIVARAFGFRPAGTF